MPVRKGLGRAGSVAPFDIRQLTDVSRCNLQQHLSCNRHRQFSACSDLPREQPRRPPPSARLLHPGSVRKPMDTIAPIRPAEPRPNPWSALAALGGGRRNR